MSLIRPLIQYINSENNLADSFKTLQDKCIPLHFTGRVVIAYDDKCFVRWEDDNRDYKQLSNDLTKYFEDAWDKDGIDLGHLVKGKGYLIKTHMHSGRCIILKAPNDGGEFEALLIDQGIFITTTQARFYEESKFFDDLLQFPFVMQIARPDDYQMSLLNFKLGFEHLEKFGKPLDIYVLSAYEPHLAVVGLENAVKAAIFNNLTPSAVDSWQKLLTCKILDSEVFSCYDLCGSHYVYENRPISVTIVGMKDVNTIYVRDLVDSLRLTLLTKSLRKYWTNNELKESSKIQNRNELKIGQIVVIEDKKVKEMVRVKVVGFLKDEFVKLRGVDHPDRVYHKIPLKDVFLPSLSISGIPACINTVKVGKYEGITKYYLNWAASKVLKSGSVGLLQRSNDVYKLSLNINGAEQDFIDVISAFKIPSPSELEKELEQIDEEEVINAFTGIFYEHNNDGILDFMKQFPMHELPKDSSQIFIYKFDTLGSLKYFYKEDIIGHARFNLKMEKMIKDGSLKELDFDTLKESDKIGFWYTAGMLCRVKGIEVKDEKMMMKIDYDNDKFKYSYGTTFYLCDEDPEISLHNFSFADVEFDQKKTPWDNMLALCKNAKATYLFSNKRSSKLYAEYTIERESEKVNVYYDLAECLEIITKDEVSKPTSPVTNNEISKPTSPLMEATQSLKDALSIGSKIVEDAEEAKTDSESGIENKQNDDYSDTTGSETSGQSPEKNRLCEKIAVTESQIHPKLTNTSTDSKANDEVIPKIRELFNSSSINTMEGS